MDTVTEANMAIIMATVILLYMCSFSICFWHHLLVNCQSCLVTHTHYARLARDLQLHRQHMQCSDALHLTCNLTSPHCSHCLSLMLVTILQLGGIGFVHYNMPLEQQVEAVKRVKQQPAGYEANPIILSPKQELKQIQDIQACAHDWTQACHACVLMQCKASCTAVSLLNLALHVWIAWSHCTVALHVCRMCFACMFAWSISKTAS